MTPHPHAEIIKKWAEGYTIEGRVNALCNWETINDPKWHPHYQYRVKPAARYYRVVLVKVKNYLTTTTIDRLEEEKEIKMCNTFVRFLTDWIEYEV